MTKEISNEETIKKLELTKSAAEWTLPPDFIAALDRAIEALKLIPDDATNGEVLERVFPDVASMLIEYFDTRWINAPYKREGDRE